MSNPVQILDGRQAREAFHLLLLDELSSRLDGDLWAVKGGVNLRVFFGSVRYSEDIDLDVSPIKRRAVRKILIDVLESGSFLRRLRLLGIQELRTGTNSVSKDTDTTLRINRQIVVGGVPFSTAIEVSFRPPHAEDRREMATLDQRLTDRYLVAGAVARAPHYVRTAAIAQKINALAHRTAVQARDVFDLCWLTQAELTESERTHLAQRVDGETLAQAQARALSMTFPEYRDQVVEYLDRAESQAFASEADWERQQLHVAELVDDLLVRQPRAEP
jgi:predicted nucleotidyltransferase component of viral defense system